MFNTKEDALDYRYLGIYKLICTCALSISNSVFFSEDQIILKSSQFVNCIDHMLQVFHGL